MTAIARPQTPGKARTYREFAREHYNLLLAAGLLAVALLVVIQVSIGSVAVSSADLFRVLSGQGQAVDPVVYTVVWELRLPRALVAMLAGAMLALAGAILQAITRNPLAEPDLTGASSGGVLLAVLWLSRHELVGWDFAPGGLELPFVAAIGSMAAGGLVYSLSRRKGTHPARLILTGVLVTTVLKACTSLILLRNQNASGSILLWIIGSLNGRTWAQWNLLWPWALIMLPLGLACAGVANVLHLGDDVATGLGLRAELGRGLMLLTAVLLTAGAVSVVGALGFLGLLAPHITRRLVGGDARRVFPLSAIFGAALLLAADIVTRTATQPLELPVGAVLALLGAPLLMLLVRREAI
ncbi:MAG: FecCD family ABC transporter permease [Chloroflexia bacterium]